MKKASGERDEVQVVRGGESEEEEAARFAIEEDQGVTIVCLCCLIIDYQHVANFRDNKNSNNNK